MLTAKQAIVDFYIREELPEDGGVTKWFDWTTAFGLPFPIPNPAARVVLVPYHDLHHIVTGYRTDEAGESEVGAWCLGSGGGPVLGQIYDLGTFFLGLMRFPSRTVGAFYRGRQGRNLYRRPASEWMTWGVEDLRTETRTSQPLGDRTAMDHLALVTTSAVAIAVWGGPPMLFAALIGLQLAM